MPAKKRARASIRAELAAPDATALMMKRTAAVIMTVLRPHISAKRPAMNAPSAQPGSKALTVRPSCVSPSANACFRPSCVPLIAPESYPNMKPPIVATATIRPINARLRPSRSIACMKAILPMRALTSPSSRLRQVTDCNCASDSRRTSSNGRRIRCMVTGRASSFRRTDSANMVMAR